MKTLGIIIFFLFSFIFFQFVIAQEAPLLPMIIEGNIIIDGKPAPVSTLIEAKIDDNVRVQYTLVEEGKYLLTIPGNKTDEGKTIYFFVNGINTNKTLTWKSGNVTQNMDFILYTKPRIDILPLIGVVVVIIIGIIFLSYKFKFRRKRGEV